MSKDNEAEPQPWEDEDSARYKTIGKVDGRPLQMSKEGAKREESVEYWAPNIPQILRAIDLMSVSTSSLWLSAVLPSVLS